MLPVKRFCSHLLVRLGYGKKTSKLSHSSAVYVSYNGHDPDLYHREYDHNMAEMLPDAKIDIVYTKIGSIPPKNFWKHDLYRNWNTVEKALEIPFLGLTKSIYDISTIMSSVYFDRIVLNLCDASQFLELCDQMKYDYSTVCPHDIIKRISADIPIPCHCYSNYCVQWLNAVQYISDTSSHIVIEYALCFHCIRGNSFPVSTSFDDLYMKAQNIFDQKGFIEYKYRHFAKDESHFSQYISLLSLGKQYLGIGPGAHSRIDKGSRLACENSPQYAVWKKQIHDMSKWRSLSQYEHVAETLLHSLDTINGIQLCTLQKRMPGLKKYQGSISSMLKQLVNGGDVVVCGDLVQVPREKWPNVTSIISDILWVFESEGIVCHDDE